jgi:hypothetical protein
MGGTCAVLTCDAGRDDCDGLATNGCETALDTLTSCGSCSQGCVLPHASETCSTGSCAIVACDPGWGNCDEINANGCETSLDTLTTCGTCTGVCDLPRASESCASGTCAVTTCEMGWGDCDTSATNGCEQNLRTLAHCGTCNAACGPFPNASATCATGACAMACDALWGDCSSAPGCETPLDTSRNCGGCGVSCPQPSNTRTSCSTGECRITDCLQGNRADCNGDVSDGCETRIDRGENCGGCGIQCGSRTCVAGFCI